MDQGGVAGFWVSTLRGCSLLRPRGCCWLLATLWFKLSLSSSEHADSESVHSRTHSDHSLWWCEGVILCGCFCDSLWLRWIEHPDGTPSVCRGGVLKSVWPNAGLRCLSKWRIFSTNWSLPFLVICAIFDKKFRVLQNECSVNPIFCVWDLASCVHSLVLRAVFVTAHQPCSCSLKL